MTNQTFTNATVGTSDLLHRARFVGRITIAVIAFLTLRCTSDPSRESALAAVLAADDARIQSRSAGDLSVLSRVYADDYVLITAEGALRTKSDQLGELQKGALQFRSLELVDRSVRVYGNAALVRSHERSQIIRNGQDIGGDFRVTRVYIQHEGHGQLVSTQATRIAQ